MNIDKRQQLLVVVAAVAVGLLAGDSFVLTPLIKAWKARSAQADELRLKIDRGSHMVNREQAVRDDWDVMRTNTLSQVESDAESLIYKAVEGWSTRSGVSVASIKTTPKSDAEEYNSLDCRVEATGALPNLTKFLYAAESSPLALKLDDVEISARDATGLQFTLGVAMNGLRLKNPQP
jgi:Tfp pilus assembly protein PilO